MKWSKIKLVLISKLMGKGIGKIYQSYIYNCNPKNYCKSGKYVTLYPPVYAYPQLIEIESYVRIQANFKAIISAKQKIIIKKFTGIGAGVTVISGEHTPTVSVPQYLSYIGVNDINNTLIIGEDVWFGANSTLLYKANVGRGAVIGANSLVTKEVPPYAVVAGVPAKIIAIRFSIEQIIEHERHLYPEEERLTRKYLEKLFTEMYSGKKVIGTGDISVSSQELLQREKDKLDIIDYAMR